MRRNLNVLLGCVLIDLLIWDHHMTIPLRGLRVFFHEMGHALATIATGGEVLSLEVDASMGGLCVVRGSALMPLVDAGGYLGSVFFGALLICFSSRTEWARPTAVGTGVLLILVCHSVGATAFTLSLGLTCGLILILAGFTLLEDLLKPGLQFVGMSSMLYALWDLKRTLLDHTAAHSDLVSFSETLGGSPVAWGLTWGVLSFVMVWFAIEYTVAREEPRYTPWINTQHWNPWLLK